MSKNKSCLDPDPLGGGGDVVGVIAALVGLVHQEPEDRVDGGVFLQQVEAGLGHRQLAVQVGRHEDVTQGVGLERTAAVLPVGVELVPAKTHNEFLLVTNYVSPKRDWRIFSTIHLTCRIRVTAELLN